MKAVLLRVGIDKGYGFLSPVFQDLSFKYIPIYYRNKIEIEKKETRTYNDLSNQLNTDIIKYIPLKYLNKVVHYDPEFETFTYGEPNNPKRGALLKLNTGDLLIFYMGGELLVKEKKEIGCFIFGYFEVSNVYVWSQNPFHNKIIEKECAENAHIRSSKSKDNLVIVKGTNRSKLLKKCIYFTRPNTNHNNPPYIAREEYTLRYGIRKNIVRATPQTILNLFYIKNLKKLLGINF